MNVFISGVKRETSLGTALAERYLKEGWKVYGAARDLTGAHLARLKAEHGDRFVLVNLDVTKLDEVNKAAGLIKADGGRLDLLISSATAMTKAGTLKIDDPAFSVEGSLNAFDVNALGFLRMAHAFLPFFPDGGKLAAISSEAGSMGDCWRDFYYDYGMAKAALNFACVTLQRALGDRLRVLAIHPGWVQTNPAPPKADLTPEESAGYIYHTIENPPPYTAKGNLGVYVNYDGSRKAF